MRTAPRWVGLLLAAGLAAVPAAGGEFSLRLEMALARPRPPAVEARLATWESPMGRLRAEVARAESGLGFSGLVGRPVGVALRVGVQPGRPPGVIAAAVRRGLDLAVRRVLELGTGETSGARGTGPRALSLGERIDVLLRATGSP